MLQQNKVVIFDFCETLANFQTADAFVYYVIHKSNKKITFLRTLLYRFYCKIKLISFLTFLFPKSSINKKFVLRQIKGEKKSFLEACAYDFYFEVIKKNLIHETTAILQNHINNGCRAIIASAGYEIYLKYFMQDFKLPLSDLIGVKIKFKKEICTGKFDGGDRLYDKVDFLNNMLKGKNVYTVAYSDSPSDMQLLEWANEAVVIRRKDKIKWNTKFKEVIWE